MEKEQKKKKNFHTLKAMTTANPMELLEEKLMKKKPSTYGSDQQMGLLYLMREIRSQNMKRKEI